MGTIELKNIRLYAFHGCLEEERKIGSDYIVNLSVKADLTKAAVTDSLEDTVDYVQLQRIVKNEMAIPSNLLEHVGRRIIDTIINELKAVTDVKVVISKLNPPIGGDVSQVRVAMKSGAV